MKFQFVSPTLHGLGDYAAAAALIILPFLLDLGADSPIALWFSIVGGIGLIVYSLLTDYTFGAASVISYDLHLVLDLVASAAFIAAPFIFGFETITTIYYIIMGAGVIVVVAVSDRSVADTEPASVN